MLLRRYIESGSSLAPAGTSCIAAGAILLGSTWLFAAPARAQTSFMAPDGKNRFPAVTIFCPSGTGVAPCAFGGGGGTGGGATTINLGGTAVSLSNRLPVTDPALDALVAGGTLSVGGTVSIGAMPSVSLSGALPAGGNAIGSVSVSNLPATQAVSGSVAVSALPALPAGTNALGSVSVSNLPSTQAVSGSVSVSALPALPAGNNAIGSVSIAGTPTFNCNGCGGSGGGGGVVTQGAGSGSNPWWMQGLGTAGTPAGGVFSMQGVAGGVALPVSGSVAVSGLPALPAGSNAIGSVSISNLPATQAVSGSVAVSALPALPAGTNAIGSVSIAGTPTFNCNGCGGGSGGGAVTQGAGSGSNPWWMQGLGSAGTPAGGVFSMQGVSGGVALPVSGSVAVSGLPALPAGGNAIGSVGLVAGAVGSVTAAGNAGSVAQAVQGISGGVPIATSGAFTQSGTWTVGVSALPALPAGTNTIGSVSLAPNTVGSVTAAGTGGSVAQAMQGISGGVPLAVSGSLAQGGTWNVGVTSLPALPAGSNAIGQVSVSNLPATQAVSAATLPLPANAATASAQAAPLAPVSPGAATATSAMLLGCQASTSLPTFAAGQQGAVPCDTSGRPYVVTVPSANNVPSYLQAVSSGGASVYRAINAASSAMNAAVKTASGMVYGYDACNSGTGAAYLRLFALGTAPVVGTSAPQMTKLLAAGTCQTMTTSIGLVFTNGIGVDVTTGSLADADTTTVATANQIVVNIYYK